MPRTTPSSARSWGRSRSFRARSTGPAQEQSNRRPSAGPQTLYGSDDRKFACKQALSRGRHQLETGAIVRSLSDDADALPDCSNEKDLQMQVFSEAADGIRTHDLLHGKQTL
jgi:hypothetical protein